MKKDTTILISRQKVKKNPVTSETDGIQIKSGIDLLSHTVTHIVPSARWGLTSLFGMGRGVTPTIKTPEFIKLKLKRMHISDRNKFTDAPIYVQKRIGKSHGLLVLLDSSIAGLISVAYQPSHLLGSFRGYPREA